MEYRFSNESHHTRKSAVSFGVRQNCDAAIKAAGAGAFAGHAATGRVVGKEHARDQHGAGADAVRAALHTHNPQKQSVKQTDRHPRR